MAHTPHSGGGLARFIGHKAGLQRLIAELEEDDVGIIIVQRYEAEHGGLVHHIRVCGNGAGDSVTHVLGILENAQMEIWHAEDGSDDGGIE